MSRLRELLARGSSEEAGAVAVLYAVFIFVVFGLLALTIDLGALKYDRRNSQTLSDNAATSGVVELDAASGIYKPQAACQKAWEYFLTNSGESSTSNNCGSFPATASCSTTSKTVTNTTANYSVQITWPVANGDALMQGRTGEPFDGLACERLGVWTTRTRGFIFGPVITGGTQGSTGASSVARQLIDTKNQDFANLLILDKTNCNALVATGGATVRVKAALKDGEWHPGQIVVDSAGTGGNCNPDQQMTVDASNDNNYVITEGNDTGAPGIIRLFGLPPGSTTCRGTTACDYKDVDASRLVPMPINLRSRVGRTPGDHTYNCKSTYPSTMKTPNGDSWNDAPCSDATSSSNYIDQLDGTWGAATSNPLGFRRWSTDPLTSALGCSPRSNVTVTGNWWVDCNGFDVKQAITFSNGNVVFKGAVTVSAGGTLTVNNNNTLPLPSGCVSVLCLTTASTEAAYIYIANGDLAQRSGGSLDFRNTMVYLRNGVVGMNGGGGSSINWVAPTKGPFKNLALWSENSGTFSYSGQAQLNLEGVYFTPNAQPTILSGGTGNNQTKAQFFTWDLQVTGGGEVLMKPDPDRGIQIPFNSGVRLIR